MIRPSTIIPPVAMYVSASHGTLGHMRITDAARLTLTNRAEGGLAATIELPLHLMPASERPAVA